MFKRIALMGLIISSSIAMVAAVETAPEKTVVWDIDKVLLAKDDQLIESTVAIAQQLHKNGVKQVLFSNKTIAEYHKLEAKYPEFFNSEIFDYERSLIQPLVWFDPRRISYRKPENSYIEDFLAKQPCKASDLYFVDDLEKNCSACNEHGMQTRIFTNNPQEVIEDLQKLGLL